jgi:hypothetical protein
MAQIALPYYMKPTIGSFAVTHYKKTPILQIEYISPFEIQIWPLSIFIIHFMLGYQTSNGHLFSLQIIQFVFLHMIQNYILGN